MNDIKKKGKAEVKNSFYKDLFFLTFGILLYSFGYTAFILPEQVVMGGVSGISALLFYAFGFPPGISIWVLNVYNPQNEMFACFETKCCRRKTKRSQKYFF